MVYLNYYYCENIVVNYRFPFRGVDNYQHPLILLPIVYCYIAFDLVRRSCYFFFSLHYCKMIFFELIVVFVLFSVFDFFFLSAGIRESQIKREKTRTPNIEIFQRYAQKGYTGVS